MGFALTLHNLQRDNVLPATFENDAWQRTRRRSGKHRAIRNREEPLVARAFERILLKPVKDRAVRVGAYAAVSKESFGGGPDQDARIVFRRVLEDFRAAHGDFIHMSYDMREMRARLRES